MQTVLGTNRIPAFRAVFEKMRFGLKYLERRVLVGIPAQLFTHIFVCKIVVEPRRCRALVEVCNVVGIHNAASPSFRIAAHLFGVNGRAINQLC
jgi:hypothetical protein